jgi:hypothetical protein
MENADQSSAISEQVAAMGKPKNASGAINAILDSVEALMPLAKKPRNDRAGRLQQAESEVFRASRSERQIPRSARLANAERDIAGDAKHARPRPRQSSYWRA